MRMDANVSFSGPLHRCAARTYTQCWQFSCISSRCDACAMLSKVISLLLLTCCLCASVGSSGDVESLQNKLTAHLSNKGGLQRRSYLAVYYVGPLWAEDSPDVYENNLKLFTSAMLADIQTGDHTSFYIFSVADRERNILSKYIPQGMLNSMTLDAVAGMSDLQSHMHVVGKIGAQIMPKFHTALFLNSETRGPFGDRASGKWWGTFSNVLQHHPRVGLIGPTINCDVYAYVQTHAFAMPGKLAHQVFETIQEDKQHSKRKQLELSITSETRKLGFSISSLLYQRRLNTTIFAGDCLSSQGISAYLTNPITWCNLCPYEVMFAKWGGMPLRNRDYYCQDSMERILSATVKIADTESLQSQPQLRLTLPETILGGKLHTLFKEYDHEVWQDRTVQRITHADQLKYSPENAPKKVCFLVRTAIMHGKAANTGSLAVNMDLDLFVKTLLRQGNINWEAYFFVTDEQPFDDELRVMLQEYKDLRLRYLPIDMKFRGKYNPIDAGYPASDEAMRQLMQKPQCAWMSITNGDNAYGSAVVETVLSAALTVTPRPNLVMLPMSSRNFDNLAYKNLREARGGYKGWTDHCKDLEERHTKHLYGFSHVPSPDVGQVDIAAIFIDRDKFVESKKFINDYNSAKVWNCKGCQDGLWVHTMVNKKGWTMHRPPIEGGLKSMVFHGPSPLWCIAAGNVWFDRPSHYSCLSHKTLGSLHHASEFDWELYNQPQGMKICLRLSEHGYRLKNNATTLIK